MGSGGMCTPHPSPLKVDGDIDTSKYSREAGTKVPGFRCFFCDPPPITGAEEARPREGTLPHTAGTVGRRRFFQRYSLKAAVGRAGVARPRGIRWRTGEPVLRGAYTKTEVVLNFSKR